LARLTVLDVGHGNAAVAAGAAAVAVVDAPLGATLLEFLLESEIREIDALLISHADADHIGGVTSLLLEPTLRIRRIYLNTEALRSTARWRIFRTALAAAWSRGEIEIHSELTTTTSQELVWDDFSLDVLSPSPVAALSGAGGEDETGRPLTANAMSAVVRVSGSRGSALLAADADASVLESLVQANPKADVLVFPHHGGLPGPGDPYDFAKRLTEAVHPEVVVFSIGRGQHNTPQPEVISGVRDGAPTAHIACTELSARCSAATGTMTAHLAALPARGRAGNLCCAGSLQFLLGDAPVLSSTWIAGHRAFIDAAAPSALCRSAAGPEVTTT
jgi:beta-lactamase superfamily II metal-dependent hydrolase